MGAILLFFALPAAQIPKELLGYLAYCLPIAATLVAGQAIFSELNLKNESSSEFNRRTFLQSFTFYFFGLVTYIVYTLWGVLEAKNWQLTVMLFFNALLMSISSYVMYLEFRRDDTSPFFRSLLGNFFALCSITIFVYQLVLSLK